MYFHYKDRGDYCILISQSHYLYEEDIKQTFPSYENGDIIYIGVSELKFPIYVDNIIREKTREEKIIIDKMTHLLHEGEIVENGKVIYNSPSKDLYHPIWKWELGKWVESPYAKTHYSQEIDILKAKILEDGFLYTDKLGKSYQQKTRDKDRSFLESSINTMIDSGINYIYWSFSNEIANMTLDELKELRKQGFLFNQVVFKIEAYLKGLKPRNVSLDEYRELVNKESIVKCWV